MAEDGVTWVRYEYDAANRLSVVKRDDANQTLLQAFQYGSTNARLIDYDPAAGVNKFYASVGGTVMAEYTEYAQYVFTWTKSYTYLGDSLLSTVTPNGAGGEVTEYNHPDRLGTRLITNQTLGTVSEQAHLPFGRPLNAESSLTTNNKRFTSYDRSAATGLDYAINRTYDSKLGRFTQVDPIGMGAASLSLPQTLNLYAYCSNDPINHTDPSGLGFFSFLKKLFKWIMVAIAVIVAVITIITAPATIAGVLGAISAGAGAAASVAGALGYNRIAKIFGLIAVVTGFGSLIAAKLGVGQKLFGFAVANENPSKLFSPWTGIFLGVGAIANSFHQEELKGKARKQWEAAVARLINLLTDQKSKCYKFLKSKGFDPEALAKDLGNQKPYDGLISTNVDPGLPPAGDGTPKGFFEELYKNNIPADAVTAGLGGNIYYGRVRGRISTGLVLHETLHRNVPSSPRSTVSISDDDLGRRLGTWKRQGGKDSSLINRTLERAGCR